MGITVAKASSTPNPAQETSLSSRLTTPTSQKSGTMTASSSSTSKKRTGKEKDTFGAMVRGLSGQGDGEGQEAHGRTSGTGNAAVMTSDQSTQGGNVKSSPTRVGQDSGAQGKDDTQDSAPTPVAQFSLPAQTDESPAPTQAKDTTSGRDGDREQSQADTNPAADMSLQVQTMQTWPALALAQTAMPVQIMASQGQKSAGTSSLSATGTAGASTMTSGSAQAGTMLPATAAALDTVLAALSSASPAQSVPSVQTMPTVTQSSLLPASAVGSSVTPGAKQTQTSTTSAPVANNTQAAQNSSNGTDTAASSPTGMDSLLAAVGQQAAVPVNASGSAASSPLLGRASPTAPRHHHLPPPMPHRPRPRRITTASPRRSSPRQQA